MQVCKITDLGKDKEFPKRSLNASLQRTDLGKDNQNKISEFKKFVFHALGFEEKEFIFMLIMV
jgi:hypothetical protein